MTELVSPNTMLDAAKTHMLDGREPESHEDWSLVMNFFAANISHDVAHQACQLMAKIYNMPLAHGDIHAIVEYQLIARGH